MSHQDMQQPTFKDLQLLAEVSQLLKLSDLEKVLNHVIQLTAKSVGAEQIRFYPSEGQWITWTNLLVDTGRLLDVPFGIVSTVKPNSLLAWVLDNKTGDIVRDTERDKRWLESTASIRSILCVPFIYEDDVIAVITLGHSQPAYFNDYHLQLITIIANQAAIALHNVQSFNRIRSQQRQLQMILQAMTDVMLVLNESGKLILLNDAAVKVLGLEKIADARGLYVNDLLKTDKMFEPVMPIVAKELGSQEDWTFETRSERLQRDYQVRMSVWQDKYQKVAGYLIVMHDVTMLRDLHRFKDEMLRVASHDLRSPLGLITGYADMIVLDTPEDNENILDYVGIIKNSAERMDSLLEEMLRVERIRNTPLELHEQIDLEQMVKIVIINVRPFIDTKKHNFKANIRLKDIPRVKADPVLIRQSMENLISNAIKYTAEGGNILVESWYEAGKFHFKVTDSGVGIPAEHLPYIFESFYRVKQDVSMEKGTGLGLSLVNNVVERHHGELWVKSQEGKGSTFGFWIPLQTDE